MLIGRSAVGQKHGLGRRGRWPGCGSRPTESSWPSQEAVLLASVMWVTGGMTSGEVGSDGGGRDAFGDGGGGKASPKSARQADEATLACSNIFGRPLVAFGQAGQRAMSGLPKTAAVREHSASRDAARHTYARVPQIWRGFRHVLKSIKAKPCNATASYADSLSCAYGAYVWRFWLCGVF